MNTSNYFKASKLEKNKKTMCGFDPDYVTVDVSHTCIEIIKILEYFNISVSTIRLINTLKNRLQQDHPIHQYLKVLDKSKLKDIIKELNLTNYSKPSRSHCQSFLQISPKLTFE